MAQGSWPAIGPFSRAKFDVYRGNVSPLWGKKPIFDHWVKTILAWLRFAGNKRKLLVYAMFTIVQWSECNIYWYWDSLVYRVKSSISTTTTGFIRPPVTSTGNWMSFTVVSTQLDTWGWCKTNNNVISTILLKHF